MVKYSLFLHLGQGRLLLENDLILSHNGFILVSWRIVDLQHSEVTAHDCTKSAQNLH